LIDPEAMREQSPTIPDKKTALSRLYADETFPLTSPYIQKVVTRNRGAPGLLYTHNFMLNFYTSQSKLWGSSFTAFACVSRGTDVFKGEGC